MQVEQLEQYIALLEAHDLTRLEFEAGEVHVALERQRQPQPQILQQAIPVASGQGQSQSVAEPAGGAVGTLGQAGASAQANDGFAAHQCVVKAPLVGSAYKSRGPGEDPFVSVGSKVLEGDVLCLLEAMKHYNEVIAPRSGTVTQILFEDGALAEFNAPLFVIEPE